MISVPRHGGELGKTEEQPLGACIVKHHHGLCIYAVPLQFLHRTQPEAVVLDTHARNKGRR